MKTSVTTRDAGAAVGVALSGLVAYVREVRDQRSDEF